MRRRRFLTATAATGVISLAGCSGIVEDLAKQALGDVNITNDTDQEVTITVVIEDGSGTVVFDESVTLSPSGETSEDQENQPSQSFNEVWESTGEYDVRAETEGGESATKTVTIEDTNNALLVVLSDDGLQIARFDEAAEETPTPTS